jgi:carboxyl-terminal processing protease
VAPIRPVKAFSDATEASARIIRSNGRRVGYVHVWASVDSGSFLRALGRLQPNAIIQEQIARAGSKVVPNDREALVKAIGELPLPLDALVVDMRGRVGGNTGISSQLLDALSPKPYWGRTRYLGRDAPSQSWPQNSHFYGRSALLIDRNTRSAAEITALGFKRGRFGPVIGTPSAGAVSSAATFLMPGDLLLYVAISGMEFDGKPLEGVGVQPDHRVERPLPYAAGADPVLEAAITLLAKPASE